MIIKTPTRQMLEILTVLLLLLTSCAAAPIGPQEVVGIQDATALWVVKQAVEGSSQSIRMASPSNGLWMFARYIPDAGGWAFTSIDMTAKDVIGKWRFCGGGNFTTCSGMADLITGLVERGWNYKQPVDLPPGFAQAAAAAGGWVSRITTMPALIVPAGSFDLVPAILGIEKEDDT